MDPVKNLPNWQRQILSNSFGKASTDLDSGKAARLEARKAQMRAKLLEKQEGNERDLAN
jgi:hypothetical protein